MKKLLLATGQEQVDRVISEKIAPELGYKVVGQIGFKKELTEATSNLHPDLVIVSKNLTGKDVSVLEAILETKRVCPNVRIIFLAGAIDERNKDRMNELATLVMAGVYDILHEKVITKTLLKDLIEHPRQREQVQYLLKYVKTNIIFEDELIEVEEEQAVEDIEEDGYANVFIVSSIKPGTGKSFISTNIATDIAKYGKKKADGSSPKVAIIEADLQNLSVGTLLQIEEDEKKNLKTVMDRIATIIDKEGNLIDDPVKIKMVDDFILSSFKQYYSAKNLYALVGSQFTMSEVEDFKPEYYIYLVEKILTEFDVIVIDTNSSLAHVTTYPLLRLCNTAFYVIDLDFNNIRNNAKYRKTLKEIDVFDKVKYVLNQDINKEDRLLMGREMVEDLTFGVNQIKDSGFDVVARIPELPKEIFLNRLYAGKPIVLDDSDYTLRARIELSKVANMIWDIENLNWLENEFQKFKDKKLGHETKRKGFFSK